MPEARVALVTGGTDGIGLEAARVLARGGHHVVLVGRDPARGERALREIRESAASDRVEYLSADLSLVRGAKRLAEQVAARFGALHVLLHSAGGVTFQRRLTEEGVEWNFALNYLSRFVLTRGLLPLLRAAGRPGRAARIMTAGGAVRNGRIDYHDVTFESGFSFFRSVSQVAHANDVWAVELARRLDPSVTIACLKFGAIRTGTRRSFPRWLRWTLAALVDPLIGRSAAEAGAAAARVATDPALESKTGTLFELVTKLRPIEPGPRVRDPEEGRRLWELSERLA